jgi:hypothetical protein
MRATLLRQRVSTQRVRGRVHTSAGVEIKIKTKSVCDVIEASQRARTSGGAIRLANLVDMQST